MEAIRHQGTSCQLGEKWSVKQLSKPGADGECQVHRYIRLTELIPEVLIMVDDGKIAFTPAVELSYLTKQEQQDLLETMEIEDCTPPPSQAIQMKRLSQAGELDIDRIFNMLRKPKANQIDKIILRTASISPKVTVLLGFRNTFCYR